MQDKTYNGWSNYETWCVSLWQDNDEGLYGYVRELAEEHEDQSDLADALKDMWEEMNPLASDASVFSDLLGAALGEVDWYEIAETLHSEVSEEVAASREP